MTSELEASRMKAMVIDRLHSLDDEPQPLKLTDLSVPEPDPDQIRVRIQVCGVCHTELDEIEGRTPPPQLPVVPGHQVIGRVDARGSDASLYDEDARVGIAWIYSACGRCKFCRTGAENLCPDFQATGRDVDGGYAQYMVVPERFAYPIPDTLSDAEAAPLLCAGAIGYRSLRLTGLEDGRRLGLTGFGASGHLVLKLARHQLPNSHVYVFARSEDQRGFARELGAVWAGDTTDESPEKLDAIIDTTPAWKPVVEALKNLEPGGRLVINAIRKEDTDQDYLLKLDYSEHLWMEKEIKSVANVARRDVQEFLQIAGDIGMSPEYQEFPLEDANQALIELRTSKIRGAKVLRMD